MRGERQKRGFSEIGDGSRNYAEDTSLQRAARKYLLSGEKLGSGLGVWTGEEKDANTADHIHTWIQEHTEELVNTADYIFRHPELSKEEVVSSACLSDYLEEKGFRITKGIAGLQTAFVAEWGTGKPILGFLAEYDALPGLGQEPVCTYQPLKTPGHGCGHNLLGTACAGAACALKERMEKAQLSGTIRVYGCPAEEIIIGKIQMNEAGVFDDLDAAITWHPFDRNRVSYDIWQAQDMKNYKFYGVKAHASKHPELGRSALDAAELMNVGVNYLREHVADDVRIHYTYTNTDGPANIVPDFASTNYFIRSSKRSRTEDASNRVDDCAKGAALMTGTRVEIELVTSNQEMKVNRPLAEAFYQAMTETSLPEYTKEELQFAETITKEAGLINDGNYFGGLEPLEDQPVLLAIGTDVSEVSHTVPTVMLSAATMCKGTPLHHWSAAAQSGMSIGQKGMLYVAECMAKGALGLLEDPKILKEAWRAHQEITIFQKLHMVIREVVRCFQRYRPFRMPLQRSKEARNFQKSGEWYIFSEFTMERSWQPISAICLTEMRFTDFIFMREPVREQKRNPLHRRTDTTIRQMPCTRSMQEICLHFWQMTEMHF